MVVPRRRASALIAEAVPGGMRKPTVCNGAPALARPGAAAARGAVRVDDPAAAGPVRFASARGPGAGVREDAPLPDVRDDVPLLPFAIPRRCAATPPLGKALSHETAAGSGRAA